MVSANIGTRQEVQCLPYAEFHLDIVGSIYPTMSQYMNTDNSVSVNFSLLLGYIYPVLISILATHFHSVE